ncbi:diguanylate cyclase [Parapedomonas caeni]
MTQPLFSLAVETDAAARQDRQDVSLSALVGHEFGPSWVVDATGNVISNNEAAHILIQNAGIRQRLEKLILQVQIRHEPGQIDLVVDGRPRRYFTVRARPLGGASDIGHVWCDAHETSLKDHMVDALRESRAMFKSLVEAAGDFSWATDSEGRIVYTSAEGALGMEPWDINGKRASELGAEAGKCFTTRVPLRPTDVWVNARNGAPVCLSVVAVPIFNDGVWSGARGIARDVTADRLAQRRLEAARRREQLYQRVLDGIRAEVDPTQMLENAVKVISEAFGADRCVIHRANVPADTSPATDAHVLSSPCRFRGVVNGELVIERRGTPWRTDDEDMLGRVADHIAVAIAQAEQMETLERISRTDGLTGLANRRAFEDEMRLRLARLDVSPMSAGTLLIVDLDHFKRLNDSRGHDAGDAALRAFAGLLRAKTRGEDVVARFGGDEFAVWLNGAGSDGGERLARALVEGMKTVRTAVGADRLSLSIGVASWHRQDDLDALMKRADQALYRVKRRGRNGYAVAGGDE